MSEQARRLVISHHAVSDVTARGKSPSTFGYVSAGVAWLLGLSFMLVLLVYLLGLFLGRDVSNVPIPVPILVLSAPSLMALGYALIFYRKRTVLDPSSGSLTIRRSMLFPVNTQTFPLEDFEYVAVRPTSIDSDTASWSVRLCRSGGGEVELDAFAKEPAADRFARKVADLVSVNVTKEAVPLKQARTEYLADRIGLGIGAAILGVLALGFNIAFTWPVIRDLGRVSRYSEGSLETVDCEIVSMRIVLPERSRADTRPGITIGAGARVQVSFRYSFGGKEYTSRRYAPIGDVAVEGQEEYPPGHKTVCYVNPRYPRHAVLVKESSAHSIAYPVIGNTVFAIMFWVMWSIARSKKKEFRARR